MKNKNMKIVEDYKQWKLDNPDEGYQYDMVDEFLADYGRGDIQGLLEYILELEDTIKQYKF